MRLARDQNQRVESAVRPTSRDMQGGVDGERPHWEGRQAGTAGGHARGVFGPWQSCLATCKHHCHELHVKCQLHTGRMSTAAGQAELNL